MALTDSCGEEILNPFDMGSLPRRFDPRFFPPRNDISLELKRPRGFCSCDLDADGFCFAASITGIWTLASDISASVLCTSHSLLAGTLFRLFFNWCLLLLREDKRRKRDVERGFVVDKLGVDVVPSITDLFFGSPPPSNRRNILQGLLLGVVTWNKEWQNEIWTTVVEKLSCKFDANGIKIHVALPCYGRWTCSSYILMKDMSK